jgi:hypothetical protein
MDEKKFLAKFLDPGTVKVSLVGGQWLIEVKDETGLADAAGVYHRMRAMSFNVDIVPVEGTELADAWNGICGQYHLAQVYPDDLPF